MEPPVEPPVEPPAEPPVEPPVEPTVEPPEIFSHLGTCMDTSEHLYHPPGQAQKRQARCVVLIPNEPFMCHVSWKSQNRKFNITDQHTFSRRRLENYRLEFCKDKRHSMSPTCLNQKVRVKAKIRSEISQVCSFSVCSYAMPGLSEVSLQSVRSLEYEYILQIQYAVHKSQVRQSFSIQ